MEIIITIIIALIINITITYLMIKDLIEQKIIKKLDQIIKEKEEK